jgi:hypothetical protein
MPYVTSDTPHSISLVKNATYQFKFTVHGTHGKLRATVGNKKILQTVSLTQSKDSKGNDVYSFKVKAVGEQKTSTGVYTTLLSQKPVLQCAVEVTDGTVPYRNLYAGFVNEFGKNSDKGSYLPTGDVLLSTEKEWDAFYNKYLQLNMSVNYSNIPGIYTKNFDFSRNSVLYHSELSAKEDVYSYAYPIDRVVVENHKPVLHSKTSDFGNGFEISAAGLRYIVLVSLKKSDLAG